MTLKRAISKRIRELLKQKNISQYQLYKLSGVPQSTISTILNAENFTIKLNTLYDICGGFNITLKEFFDCDYFSEENISD